MLPGTDNLRGFRRKQKKTLNKVDEHTGFSQWCRLSDSPKNHHLNTIPKSPFSVCRLLMQKANCCSPEIYSICKYSHGKKKSFSTQRNISPTQKPTPGAQKQQNRQKLLDRTNLNTCKLLINDNARFSTEIAKIYKGQNFKSIFSLVFARKPGWKSACHNPAGIVI